MLSKEDILNNLKRLGEKLKNRGMEGEILLTGGAAMCLVHSARDMTKDIDALYEPKELINQLVMEIADAEGLPHDWLNDSVKGFVTPEAPVQDFMSFEGLKITTVSPEYLLAMKLMSSRIGEKDAEDIRFLLRELDITTMGEACDILTAFFPIERILPKTMYMLEDCMAEMTEDEQEELGPTMNM
jgi:hypothetical protein